MKTVTCDCCDSTNGEGERDSKANVGELLGLVVTALVIPSGAFMMAESIVKTVTGSALLFEGVNPGFEFIVGLVIVILAASKLRMTRGFGPGQMRRL